MLAPAMKTARLLLPACLILGTVSARAFETRDRVLIELSGLGVGPGIPVEGEGLAFGGSLGALVHEEDGDVVLLFRPALTYVRTIDGWADDPRTMDLAGVSASIGFGIPDLGRVLPYVEVGLDPTAFWTLEPTEAWDWSLGIHGDFGAMFSIDNWLTIRPAVGVCSFLFTDLDRPLGGLWFALAFGFDVDPYEEYEDYEPEGDFWIQASAMYPSPGQPGGAAVWIERASGFTDAVDIWVDTPLGVQAVVLPDTTAGPDHWKVLALAAPEACAEFPLTIHARADDQEQTQTVYVQPTCGQGGAP
jgi:hypothetical protein